MRASSPYGVAVADFSEAVRLAPLWWRLSLEQTFNRYRRTVLGPFWLASATIAQGLAIAFVFGSLMGGDWREFLPRIMGGLLAWSLVAGFVVHGANTYLGAGGMMQSQRMPLSFYAFLNSSRVLIDFVHQMIAFWLIMAPFGLLTVPHWSFLPALLIVSATGLFLSIPVGMLSARYRDIGFMVGTVMGALFLLSPVFWTRAQLSESKRWIVDFNPFAHLLEILRQAFLGQLAPLDNWTASIGCMVASALFAWISLALYRKRVIFWL